MCKYYMSDDEHDIIKRTNGAALVYRYGTEKWMPYNGGSRLRQVTAREAQMRITENRAFYDKLLALADRTARQAHEGQLCRDGQPYVTHPRTVASFLEDTEHKIIALLHDTIEDTDMTADKLRELGFTERIVRSVTALTHDKNTDYMDYIAGLKEDPNARYVKLADLRHNMDITRIPEPTEHDLERMEKYKKAVEVIRSWD